MGLHVDDPFVAHATTPTTRVPTSREIAALLRAVNPKTTTAITIPPAIWDQVSPLYERLLLDQRRAKRAAWKRWRAAIEPICLRLEQECSK